MAKHLHIKHYLFFLAIVGLSVVFSCEKEDPLVITGNIEGTINDIETNSVIQGANVSLTTNGNSTFIEQSKTTGSDGKFSFKDLEAGSYKLSFKKEGYEDNSKNITLLAGQTSSSDVGMKPVKPKLSVSKTELNFGTSEAALTFQVINSGKGELKWEIKESIDWLSVSPPSGTTTNEMSSVSVLIDRGKVEPGNYEKRISVTSNGGDAEILIKVVIEGPKLEVSPLNLDFGSDKTKLSLFLKNIGVGSMDYTVKTDFSWISINPNSGNLKDETDQIDVAVNRNGLNFGNYTGTINIISKTITVAVDVQMIIPDPNKPQLSISRKIINFGTQGTSEILVIKNSGNGILEWNLTNIPSWIEVSKSSGSLTYNQPSEITVTAKRTGLSPNKYAGFINVSSNGGTETCNIEMEIPSAPVLFFEPDILNFGHNKESLTFAVKNNGTGNLNWNLLPNKDWIKLSETSGTNQSSITVTVDREKMILGIASGQISITTNGGSGSVTINAEKRNPNIAPVADFSITPPSGFMETNFILNVTCSDDYTSNEKLLIRWKWENSDAFTAWSNSKSGSHTYSTTGTKNITVEVKDEDEAVRTITKSVEVNKNEKPVASFTVTPSTGTINTEFVFDASNCSDDYTSKENLQIRWQWEDGESFTNWSTTKAAKHKYSAAGNKTITLEVKDETGLTNSTTQKVTLQISEQEPNNKSTEAQVISLNSKIFGSVGVQSDNVDYYSFTPTENGYFFFSIKHLGPNNSTIGDCGLFKVGFEDYSNTITGINALWEGQRNSNTVPVSKGVKYLIKIPAAGFTYANYELDIIFESISEVDWGEPNNFITQATSINLNTTITALIGYSDDDMDYYVFTPSKTGTFSFSVKNLHPTSVSNGDIDRCLLYKYGDSDYIISNSNSEIKEGATATSGSVILQGGTKYIIKIPQYGSNYAAPYELKTTFQ